MEHYHSTLMLQIKSQTDFHLFGVQSKSEIKHFKAILLILSTLGWKHLVLCRQKQILICLQWDHWALVWTARRIGTAGRWERGWQTD